MNETTLQIPAAVTFEQAINLTQQLLEQIQNRNISPQQIENFVRELVNSINGARGFFVVYSTNNYSLDDASHQAVISGLKTSPKIVSELLTKNLVMSTAMAITHTRNNDPEMAQQSINVQERTVDLIKKLQLSDVFEELQKIQQTLEKNEGVYQDFLEKWNYDTEQRQAMYQIVTKTLEM